MEVSSPPLQQQVMLQRNPVAVRSARTGLHIWPSRLSIQATVGLSGRSERALRVATSFVARSLSTAHFYCGQAPARYYQDYFAWRPIFWWLRQGMTIELDAAARSTSANVFGLAHQQADFHDVVGSITGHSGGLPSGLPAATPEAAGRQAGDLAVAESALDDRLAAILSREVVPRGRNRRVPTKALLVVRNGELVGEAYAPDFDAATPIIGYSLAKTLCNAIVGRMVETGHLDPEERDLFTDWRSDTDKRRDISLAHLLQMTSGLEIAETHSGYDPVSHMLFLTADMGEFAARSALATEPGRRFDYTSGNTLLAARLMRDRLGGDHAAVLDYLERELLAPCGMEHMLVEFDAAGTPILSTFCYASARDWARLGLLYLNDGCVGSKRLLPHGWVEFSKKTDVEPSYGAGLRLSRAGGQGDRWLLAGLPEDSFYAHGHLGQYVLVIPSIDAVIVRLGTSAPSMRAHDRAIFAEIAAAIADR